MRTRPVFSAGPRRLVDFLAALDASADQGLADDDASLQHVARLLGALVSADDWLDNAFCQPADRYQQYLLFCDPRARFSVVSFVWGPGQRTPIHDHTVWGIVGMLRGAETTQSYKIFEGRPVGGPVERLEPGDVATISPRHGDMHQVRNAFDDRVSISIHVYGGNIGEIERGVYREEGGRQSFVSGYANEYLPNPWATRR